MQKVGLKAAQQLKESIFTATYCLSSTMEEVILAGKTISDNICAQWVQSLQDLQKITKDFNITINDSVTKLISSINKAIDSHITITTTIVNGWLASLKEIERFVNMLPYVGQHMGEYTFKNIGIAAIDMIITKMIDFLQHPLTCAIIIQFLLRLFIVNLQLLFALFHDPYVIYMLPIILFPITAIHFWHKKKKVEEEEKPKECSHNVGKFVLNSIFSCFNFTLISREKKVIRVNKVFL